MQLSVWWVVVSSRLEQPIGRFIFSGLFHQNRKLSQIDIESMQTDLGLIPDRSHVDPTSTKKRPKSVPKSYKTIDSIAYSIDYSMACSMQYSPEYHHHTWYHHTWYQVWVDVGSILGRLWSNFGSMFGRLFVDFGSTWERCGTDPGSIRGQFALIRCRFATFSGLVKKSAKNKMINRLF